MWVRSHKNYIKLPEQSRKPSNTYLVLPGFLRWLRNYRLHSGSSVVYLQPGKGDFFSVALQKSEGELLKKNLSTSVLQPKSLQAHQIPWRLSQVALALDVQDSLCQRPLDVEGALLVRIADVGSAFLLHVFLAPGDLSGNQQAEELQMSDFPLP